MLGPMGPGALRGAQGPDERNMSLGGSSVRFMVRVRVRGLVLGPMGPGALRPLGGPRAQM